MLNGSQLTDYNGEDALDISSIIDMVKSAGVDALMPDELEIYNSFVEEAKPKTQGHYANLAETLDSGELSRIAMDVVNWVMWDEQSRNDWSRREREGIRMLGVSDMKEGGANFEGASKAVHPLLIEAVMQFQARAIAELMPISGIVQTVILGETNPYVLAQSKRVEDYLNYLYLEKMPGAFEEMDSLLFRLPLSGSCFKHIYYDPILEVPCSRFIEPADFIVPFTATDLDTTARFTHRSLENANSIRKKMAVGFYAGDVERYSLTSPNEAYDYPIVKQEIDHTEGKSRVQINNVDERFAILEMSVYLVLKGFEDKDDLGMETGVALPYIATVDRDNQRVLRLVRNYKPDDPKKKRTIRTIHYKFTPGLGFYGYGLLHMIGGLANSATGALRALLDSAQFANQQGGFKTRDSKILGGDLPIAPGEWREVNSSAEELAKAFFPLPAKEPNDVLFRLLGYLDDRAQRVASTTDIMLGDAPANQAVGTAMQNMENGSKMFSAIHLRLHKAFNKELRILADLVKDHIPDDGYPYLIKGASNTIMATDFDDRVDVIPTSDPNLISQAHKIAQAQGILQLATQFPNIINEKVAIQRMLNAMKAPGIEELMTPEPSNGLEEQQQQLTIQKLQAEIARLQAQTNKETAGVDNINADTGVKKATQVKVLTDAQFSAIETAEVLTPINSVIADAVMDNAGYQPPVPKGNYQAIDVNALENVTQNMPLPQQQQPQLDVHQNTHALFPPNPPQPHITPAQIATPEQQAMPSDESGLNTPNH